VVMYISIAVLVFAFIYLSTSKIEEDVPVVLWSDQPVLPYFHDDSISSTNLVDLLNLFVSDKKPKLFILYLEPEIRTYEASLFNSPDSVFSKLQTDMKNFNSAVIPYCQIDSSFVNSLFADKRPLVYFSGVNGHKTNFGFTINEIKNLQLPELSIDRTTFLVVDLFNGDSPRSSQFAHSGKIVEEVKAMLFKNGITDVLSIYTGYSSKSNPIFEDVITTTSKRSISTVQASEGIPWGNITQPNWFNKWFPGYFWELLFVWLIFLTITMFGVCQLSQIQVPSKFPTPKKQAKNL